MKNPKHSAGDGGRTATLVRLRYQSWLAAILLFSSWLSTIFFCRSMFQDEPVAIMALLPGLAVATHLQGHLSRHLATNHRYHEEDRLCPTLGAANWITLLRAAAIVVLAGFLPMAFPHDHLSQTALSWAPGIIYLGIALADLLDGFIARRQGCETELGRRLDIETDAAGLLVASLLGVALGRLPLIYLLVGLAYYPFILGIRLRQWRALPVLALQPRPYARIIAGLQMGLAGAALLPIFNPAFLSIAAVIFMTPLLTGFCRDWMVVSCRIKTDADQQASLDLLARSLMMRALPWALRLILLAGGILTFFSFGLYRTHPTWQLAHSLCCLTAGLGVMGRTTALFLVLLLGCSHSPFGMSWPAVSVFAAAAALMLTGTGTISVWAPEERILYRRKKEKHAA